MPYALSLFFLPSFLSFRYNSECKSSRMLGWETVFGKQYEWFNMWFKALKWQPCLVRFPGESNNSFILRIAGEVPWVHCSAVVGHFSLNKFIRWNTRAVNLRDVSPSSHANVMTYENAAVLLLSFGFVIDRLWCCWGSQNYVQSVVWFQHLEKPKGDVHVRFDLVLADVNMTCGKILPKFGDFVSSQLVHQYVQLSCLRK